MKHLKNAYSDHGRKAIKITHYDCSNGEAVKLEEFTDGADQYRRRMEQQNESAVAKQSPQVEPPTNVFIIKNSLNSSAKTNDTAAAATTILPSQRPSGQVVSGNVICLPQGNFFQLANGQRIALPDNFLSTNTGSSPSTITFKSVPINTNPIVTPQSVEPSTSTRPVQQIQIDPGAGNS